MNDDLQQVDRTYVIWRGRKLSYFAGCDYLRLASHPRVVEAVETGLRQYGLNVAASRLTTGGHRLYAELETALARFFQAPAALLAPTGYSANLIAAQAMRDDPSHILLDERAHASLRDASRFFSSPVLEFKHRSPADLSRRLARLRGRIKPLLLTDGVFAHSGEVAPLRDYLKILPAGAAILLDDAHSAGILGATGQGTIEYAGVPRRRIIQTITLSKAFGVYGGAILCDRPFREKMIARSSIFAGSTPLPLPLVNAALTSLDLVRRDLSLRCRLTHNVNRVKSALRSRGLAIPDTPAPIIAILPRRAAEAEELRRRLLAADVFPSFIRYPGGPATGYFRFAISSEHSPAQLDALLEGTQAQ